MSGKKQLFAGIGCREGRPVSLGKKEDLGSVSLTTLAYFYNDNGADGLLLWDMSEGDEDHERTIGMVKELARRMDIPVITGGRVRRLEDVKKYLYAGAKAVFLDGSDLDQVDLIQEAANRFGGEKIYVWLPSPRLISRTAEFSKLGASRMILDVGGNVEMLEGDNFARTESSFLFLCNDSQAPVVSVCMASEACAGVVLTGPKEDNDCMEIKQELRRRGIQVDTFASSMEWKDFKTGTDGLMPVIVQDYKTEQVLMMAYMNEQAFRDTLQTGKMNYYSRSRKSQWL